MSLDLYSISDRELLFRLDDIADSNGLATSQELAEALGMRGVEARQVAIRLSWMKRYGAVTTRDTKRESEETGRMYKVKGWTLTTAGKRFIFGRLNTAQERSLGNIDDEQLVQAVEVMAARYKAVTGLGKTLMHRQWRNGTGIGRRR